MTGSILRQPPDPITFKSQDLRAHFTETLRSMDYAVVDFDGTVYPRLFVFDVTKRTFEQHSDEEEYKKKLKELSNIAQIYASGDFVGAYAKFLQLLEGEDKNEFQENARHMIVDSYEYAKRTIDKLRKTYGMKVYMISLTADFIGEAAQEYFDFQRVFSVGYMTETTNKGIRFTGETAVPIEDPQAMKRKMLLELQNSEGGERSNFVCFFDSVDDLPVAKSAALRIGVNPKPVLLENVDFDVILRNKESDPWKEFYSVI